MNTASNSALVEPETSFGLREEYSRLPIPHSPFKTTLFCCVALLIALAWPFVAGRVYVGDDLGAMHLPMRMFYSRQLAAGEPFDWNPDLFGGFYLTGEGQAGTYHPLHWLLYRLLQLPVAFDLECLISYPFMLAGMYVFLRRWRLRREAALFGAMTFTYGGFNLLHFVHPNVVAIVAHLPWLLVAIDIMARGAKARDRRVAFGAVALLTGSQLLLGSPQFVLFSLILEAGYVFWLAGVSGLLRWGAAISIGCVIGGVQLLPSIDALSHSVRQSAGTDLAAYGSLHPLNLIQLVGPYMFDTRVVGQNTHELGLYVGAAPLVLAVWWLLNGQKENRNRITVFATVTALAALLWAFGADGPLGWLETYLPVVNRFRFPSRAIVLFQLAVATLGALGFATLARQSKRSRPAANLWWLPAASVTFGIVGLICWRQHLAAWPLVIAGPILLTSAAWLIIRAADGSRWALAAIVIFSAVDLGVYGMTYSIVGQSESLTEYIRTTDVPPGEATGRVAIDLMSGTETANGEHGPRVGDRILLTPWKCIDGYLGLEPARRLDYRQPDALRVAGVAWASAEAAARIKDFDSRPNEGWYSLADRQLRAWLVTRAVVSNNPAADISQIDVANEALVDRAMPSLTGGIPGVATFHVDRPGRFELKVDSPASQLLVISESYHDGWRATVDGQPAGVVRADGDFLGLILPGGVHAIRLEFRPKSLLLGRALSGFGLGLIGVVLMWPRRRSIAD